MGTEGYTLTGEKPGKAFESELCEAVGRADGRGVPEIVVGIFYSFV